MSLDSEDELSVPEKCPETSTRESWSRFSFFSKSTRFVLLKRMVVTLSEAAVSLGFGLALDWSWPSQFFFWCRMCASSK